MYDLMGIQQAGIADIQSALDTYKAGVDEPLSQISSQADYALAFKGSNIAESMKGYLDAVIVEIQKMTSYLDEFRASLDVVAANYEAQASTVSGTVGTDAANVTGVEVNTTTGVNGFQG